MNINSFTKYKEIVLSSAEMLKKTQGFKYMVGIYFIYNAIRLNKLAGNNT